MKKFAWIPLLALLFASCTKSGVGERYLIIKFKFNDTLTRKNDAGNIIGDSLGFGNAALTPNYNSISANYIGFFANDSSKITDTTNATVYVGAIKDSIAIDFSQAKFSKDGEVFIEVPLSSIKAGSYQWMGVGLAYSNMDIPCRIDNVFNGHAYNSTYTATVSTLLGASTYIKDLPIKSRSISVNSLEPQGFLAFETTLGYGGFIDTVYTQKDRVFTNSTTVVNPLFGASMPKTFGIVTAKFNKSGYIKTGGEPTLKESPLVITGLETESITIECQLSTRNSFIWQDNNQNKLWEPFLKEAIIDMGLRGMKPIIK